MMSKLSKDVILEILLRLPVKSLLRFRCVCKTWCNLIQSLDFIAMHFNHPTAKDDHHVLIKRCLQDRVTNVLSIHSNTELLSTISPDIHIPHFDHEFVQLLGPCNGLVCVTDYETIVLCNPATKEFTLLPERPFGCPQDMYCTNSGVGFGFDANINDYKVIRIVDLVDEDDYTHRIVKAEVYQCRTDSWKEIDHDLPHVWWAACFETFFHGAAHWYAQRENEKVLSFSITNEAFQEFDFPDDIPIGKGNRKSLTVLNESLALLSYTDYRVRTEQQFIDIWVMREYGVPKSWTKQFTIGPLSEINFQLTSWKNYALLLERINGQLISCALVTKEIKEFDIFAYPLTLRALIYKESLVSIKRISANGAL